MAMSASPIKKRSIQTTLMGFFKITPPLSDEVKVHETERSLRARRSTKRRRSSTPRRALSPEPEESGPEPEPETAKSSSPPSGRESRTRRLKPFKLRIRPRISSSSSELESVSNSESDSKQSKARPAKTEKRLKKLKLRSPKSTPEAERNGTRTRSTTAAVDKRKTKGKFSTRPDNVRPITSYFDCIVADVDEADVIDLSSSSGLSESSSTPTSTDEDDDDFVQKSKKRKKKKITSKLRRKKEREKEIQRLKEAKESKEPKRVMSRAVLDFLQSGVPDQITKVQKSIEKKKVGLELEQPLQLFPTFSHNVEPAANSTTVDFTKWTFPLKPSDYHPLTLGPQLGSWSSLSRKEPLPSGLSCGDLCCGKDIGFSPHFLSILAKEPRRKYETDGLAWVDKYRVERRSDLVIDKAAHHKFEKWLRQWRSDIKDDGGTSRKIVEKKRRKRDSDSDFITDEEAEDEFLKKSVILVGPTGCGKTAMVYVLAKQIGFKVVEVSFSSRRSGKDVLQSVEEATLSRRISEMAEVDDQHCLLLFKDIDQIHVEEDEGFHAAVAQLITASCRPIVMTICQANCCITDPKIHKKDPLWIYFQPPSPTAIVNKMLLPIIEAELKRIDRKYDLDSNEQDKRLTISLLDSLARHSGCDMRKSLNQAQVMWSSKNLFNVNNVHWTLCTSLNLGFTHSCPQKDTQFAASQKKKTKAERLVEVKEMEELARNLELLTEYERVTATLEQMTDDTEPIPLSHKILPYFHIAFQSSLLEMSVRSESSLGTFRSLSFQTDEAKANQARIADLYDELSSYVDHFNNYDAIAYVRTIVKQSVVRSVGSEAKRNGRIKPYFNRLGRDEIDRMCNNFDFPDELVVVKRAFGLDTRSSRR